MGFTVLLLSDFAAFRSFCITSMTGRRDCHSVETWVIILENCRRLCIEWYRVTALEDASLNGFLKCAYAPLRVLCRARHGGRRRLGQDSRAFLGRGVGETLARLR